jgi:hypothetical protein
LPAPDVHIAVPVTLVIAVAGLIFWVGEQAQEIVNLKTTIALVSPLEIDHRLTSLEERMQSCEQREHAEPSTR